MFRTLSIASSFFAACFIVATCLGLLAWGSSAAFADEPLTANCTNDCYVTGGVPCGLQDCSDNCYCDCDGNCVCHQIFC
jgi:hypothetical protein